MSEANKTLHPRFQSILIWAAVALAITVPLAAAATSPLLEWRRPAYIAAGFAGILGLALMLLQPLLIGGYLPGLAAFRGRRFHRWIGALLIASVLVHVIGLWITSPPDVVDALLFRSPTPFSPWGVISMWAIFAVGVLAMLRQPLRLRLRTWRVSHTILAIVIVISTIVHAVLIEGTMETLSKVALSALVVAATLKVMVELRVWVRRAKPRQT